MIAPFDKRGLTVGNHRLPCPACDKGPRDTALSVTIEDDGAAVWICFRCGMKGSERQRDSTAPYVPPPKKPAAFDALAVAQRIWKESVPLAGTLGEAYLRLRLCQVPPVDGDLRFHPSLYCADVQAKLPALVAKVTTVIDNVMVGVHRIWIREGERKAVCKKRLGGSDAPVCVRLWPDDAVTMGLAIAEGIESACAAALDFAPVWSTIDAGGMLRFPLLDGIEVLTIVADRDAAGMRAAYALQAAYVGSGRCADIIRPKIVGHDYNDVAQESEVTDE